MVKLYCKKINRNEKDRVLDCKNHEELDDLPRKSVGQQVEAFLLAGQNLEMSRRALFELKPYDDDNLDIDDFDTGLDEYSDRHDLYQAQQELTEKYVKLNNLRKEQALRKKKEQKEEPIVRKNETVDNKEVNE